MQVKESSIRDVGRLIIWFPFRRLVLRLPPFIALRLYRLMGSLHYHLAPGKAREIIQNLPPAILERWPAERVARLNIQTHYMDRLCIFSFPVLDAQNISKIIRISGLERLDECLSLGKGCILLHSHFGPAQLSLVALGLLGYPMNQLGLRKYDNEISFIGREVQAKQRLRIEEKYVPGNMLYIDRFMRPVFEKLAMNEVLMMAGDAVGGGRFYGKYETCEILGKKMRFPCGWASLSRKTGAQVLPLSLREAGRSSFAVEIGEPISLIDSDADYRPRILQFARILENDILHYPHLWHFWDEFHPGNLLVE